MRRQVHDPVHAREDSGVPGIQERVACVMEWVVRLGVGIMLLLFILYASGIITSESPPADVAEEWTIGPDNLDQPADVPWAWLAGLADSLSLSFAALVFFPIATIVLLVLTCLQFVRARLRLYAVLVGCQVVILLVAAIGLVGAS